MQQPDQEQISAIERIHKTIGVELFKRSPDGFDATTASNDELVQYGYPPRPGAEADPEAHDLWRRLVDEISAARPSTVEPEFAVMPGRRRPSVTVEAARAASNWAGSVAYAPQGSFVTEVVGQWTVSSVAYPDAGPGGASLGTWVGIDGYTDGALGGLPVTDLVQAGTAQDVGLAPRPWGGTFSYSDTYAWFEWVPDDPVRISAFRVQPGDIMSCAIWVVSPTAAGVWLHNISSGEARNFLKFAPATGAQILGRTAEWILEAPTVNGSYAVLPRFGEVYFDQCVAMTSHLTTLLGGQGHLLSIRDTNGRLVAESARQTDRLISIRYP